MFSYTKIATIALIILLGVPAVSFAGSFTTSLIQGKSPSEALEVISEQVDILFGRIDSLETKQTEIVEDISNNQEAVDVELEKLRLENENLKLKIDLKADVVTPPFESKECIAIKSELESSRKPYSDQIKVLNDELRVLYRERSDIKNNMSTFKSDKEDEIERIQEELQGRSAAFDAIEEKVDVVKDKIGVLKAKLKEVITPTIEKAERSNCLLG